MNRMSELLREAVWGGVIGATLGAARRGRPYQAMKFYDPIPLRMAPTEAIDAWVVAARHLRQERPLAALSQSYERHWPTVSDETRFGLGAVQLGFSSPLSGRLFNPLTNGSNAFLRAAFWGLIHYGHPDAACEWAYMDAAMDHAGDGAWLPVAFARMVAAARPGLPATALLRAALDVLPPDSDFLRAAPLILEHAGKSNGLSDLALRIPRELSRKDGLDAALTMTWIVAALLREKSFGPRVASAGSFGGAADQSAGCVGIVAALLEGQAPRDWRQPLGDPYVASYALRGLDLPETIDELADLLLKARLELYPAEDVPADPTELASIPTAIVVHDPDLDEDSAAAAEPKAAVTAPEEPSTRIAAPADALKQLLSKAPNWADQEAGGVTISLAYIDSPIYLPGQPMNLAVSFHNAGKREKKVEPEITVPEGWTLAARLQPFRLPHDHTTTFPFVVRPPDTGGRRGAITISVGRSDATFPLVPAEGWWLVGPLANDAGDAFEKPFPAETVHKAGQVFNGRSGLAAKWELKPMAGVLVDLEPMFKHSSGAAVLWAKVRLPKAGTYSLVASFGVGVVAWVDGTRLIRYHDEHEATHRPTAPYRGEFKSTGESTVVVKLLRSNKPLLPGALYFLDADGALVMPDAFLPMPPA
jgi:hypothetical protein